MARRAAFAVVLVACLAAAGDWSGGATEVAAAAGPSGDRAAAAPGCLPTEHTRRVVRHVKRHGKSHRRFVLKHFWRCEEAPASAAPSSGSPAPANEPTESASIPAGVSAPEPIATPPALEVPTLTPPPVEPEPEANALGVAAEDKEGFFYTLSRPTVRAGRLTLQLDNRGEDPHDMVVERLGPGGEPEGTVVELPVTGPGSQSTVGIDVAAGTYRMWCNLRDHAARGMDTTFTVE